MDKVSTCLDLDVSIEYFSLAFEGGGNYEYGNDLNQPGNKGLI